MGRSADERSDIWAFGCVLYEMLVARPTFGAETISDTIARILEREPDWQALPIATPKKVPRSYAPMSAEGPGAATA